MLPFVAIVSLLTSLSLEAQTRVAQNSEAQTADASRQHIEQIAARQEKAVAAMAVSIMHQQLSVGRQARDPQHPVFFHLPSAGVLRPGHNAALADSLPAKHIDLAETAARRTSLEPEPASPAMHEESGFPATPADPAVNDLSEPQADSVDGVTLLRQLLDGYGIGVPAIPESLDYVRRILSRFSTVQSEAWPKFPTLPGHQISRPATAPPISANGWSGSTVGNNPATQRLP